MTPAMETIHILVVDDEASIRHLAERELSSERRLISTAGSAQQAFKRFKRQAFDVILLDMRLPDGDGLDLLTRFQELAPEIQVVIITAFATVDNAVQAMKLCAYYYITKPFDLDRL